MCFAISASIPHSIDVQEGPMAEEDREREELEPQQKDQAARRRRSERQLQSESSDRSPLREPDFDPTSRGEEPGEVL
jgi:hypothetical protein